MPSGDFKFVSQPSSILGHLVYKVNYDQRRTNGYRGDLRYVLTPELEKRVSILFQAIEIVTLHQMDTPYDLCDLHKVLAENLVDRKGGLRLINRKTML